MYFKILELYRRQVRMPIKHFMSKEYQKYLVWKDQGISALKDILINFFILSTFVVTIMSISIFLYVLFQSTYMPNQTHIRPVHFQFDSCDERVGVCSMPSAYVKLMHHSQTLMAAQPYRVTLVLHMPESQVNKDLGMFMVCVRMRAKGFLVDSSCRSVLMKHRSPVHQLLRTLLRAPLLLAGLAEETQQLNVELFSDFQDDQDAPVMDAYVELHSRFVQLYSSELLIEAHFSGLRYFMFHWPKLSGVIGISTNFVFVSLVFILSWHHFQESVPYFLKNKSNGDAEIEKSNNDDLPTKAKLEFNQEMFAQSTPSAVDAKSDDDGENMEGRFEVNEARLEYEQIMSFEFQSFTSTDTDPQIGDATRAVEPEFWGVSPVTMTQRKYQGSELASQTADASSEVEPELSGSSPLTTTTKCGDKTGDGDASCGESSADGHDLLMSNTSPTDGYPSTSEDSPRPRGECYRFCYRAPETSPPILASSNQLADTSHVTPRFC